MNLIMAIFLFSLQISPHGEIAYGEIRFGDSYDQMLTKLDMKPILQIGSYRYGIVGRFVDEEQKTDLYGLRFSSFASYSRAEIQRFWQNLIDVISVKYGRQKGSPFSSLFNGDGLEISHLWKLKNKRIWIGIVKTVDGYSATLSVEDQKRMSIVLERVKKKQENDKRGASRKF